MGKAFTPRGAGLKENPGSLMGGGGVDPHPCTQEQSKKSIQPCLTTFPQGFGRSLGSLVGEVGGGDGLIPAPQRGGGFGLGET